MRDRNREIVSVNLTGKGRCLWEDVVITLLVNGRGEASFQSERTPLYSHWPTEAGWHVEVFIHA